MNPLRAAFVFIAAVTAGLKVANAQVDFYVTGKEQVFLQTSAATPAPAANPFRFFVEISGTAIGGITNHAFTPPGGSLTNIPSQSGSSWKFQQNFSTKGAMDTALPNGSYSLDVATATGIPLALDASPSGDLYSSVTPQLLGMTNGAFWNGSNQLVIYAGLGSTLSLSTFTEYGGTSNGQLHGHLGASLMNLSGPFFEIQTEAATFDSDPSFNSFTIPGGSLTAGETYLFELSYDMITALDTSSLGGATGVALFSNRLVLTVMAIPEPSTYAAIAGALALSGAMLQRRWRTSRFCRP